MSAVSVFNQSFISVPVKELPASFYCFAAACVTLPFCAEKGFVFIPGIVFAMSSVFMARHIRGLAGGKVRFTVKVSVLSLIAFVLGLAIQVAGKRLAGG